MTGIGKKKADTTARPAGLIRRSDNSQSKVPSSSSSSLPSASSSSLPSSHPSSSSLSSTLRPRKPSNPTNSNQTTSKAKAKAKPTTSTKASITSTKAPITSTKAPITSTKVLKETTDGKKVIASYRKTLLARSVDDLLKDSSPQEVQRSKRKSGTLYCAVMY